MADLQIGSVVWTFDANRRRYVEGQSAPVYRYQFQPLTITGETARSWIAGPAWDQIKINKKTLTMKGGFGLAPYVLPSEQAVDDACWIHDHVIPLAEAVRRCKDIAVLRRIADLLKGDPA